MIFGCVLLVVVTYLILIILLFIKVKSVELSNTKIDLEEVTLVIPFRNEVGNLPNLLNQLNLLKEIPISIIFVNDHSSDNSMELVKDFLNQNNKFKLVNLSDDFIGKKRAIQKGVEEAKTEFILTIDADVSISDDYFQKIRQLNHKYDMYILPVHPISSNFWSKIFSMEYLFFNAFNYLVTPFYVLSASGANLLFRKEAYLKNQEVVLSQNNLSGDDYFLLRAFQEDNRIIQVHDFSSSVIKTNESTNFKNYLAQRTRWLGKTKSNIQMKEFFLGLLILAFLWIPLGLSLYYILTQNYLIGLIFLIAQFVISFSILKKYLVSEKLNFMMLLFFLIFYPFLFLTTLIFSLIISPNWKGRTLRNNLIV